MKSQSLNGISLVATASVPLYHLYTPEAFFEGKVSWQICGSDKSVGYISSIVHRSDDKNSGRKCFMDEMNGEQSPSHCHMRRIQPLNLQKSYSPEATKRQSVDPPSCSYSASKRKVDQNRATEHSPVVPRENKRFRISQEMNSESSKPSTTNTGQAHNKVSTSWGTESRHFSIGGENGIQLEVIDDPNFKVNSREKCDTSQGIPSLQSWESNTSMSKHGKKCINHDWEIKRSTFRKDQEVTFNVGIPLTSSFLSESNETVRETINTPVQASRKADLPRIETCEKGSSPIQVTLRCADASTSPCGDVPVPATRKSFDEVMAKDETTTDRSENQNLSSSNEENKEFGVHQNRDNYISNAFRIKRRSNENPIYSRLEQVLAERGQDDNKSKPRQLRTQVMENYFDRPNANYDAAAQGCKRTPTPGFSRSSSILNMGHRVLSDYRDILRSPLRSTHDPWPCDRNKSTRQFQSTTTSPTAHNILSNRERIERIFSGKK
ncbi:hypothetical protein HJC23_005883 [Cyclotella cryptica]|uniref:Uncharacterized protein n=1 Tax=Cyclotella cryptica TaxID=29204 RepID=A0ABD3QZD3_9STRA